MDSGRFRMLVDVSSDRYVAPFRPRGPLIIPIRLLVIPSCPAFRCGTWNGRSNLYFNRPWGRHATMTPVKITASRPLKPSSAGREVNVITSQPDWDL